MMDRLSTLLRSAALDGERTYDLFAFAASHAGQPEICIQVIGTEKPLVLWLDAEAIRRLIELTVRDEK